MNNDFLLLPDGLKLTPMEPTWFTTLWPMRDLTSSIGSVVMTLAIFFFIIVASLILAHLSRTFLPSILKKLVSFLFILTAIAALAGGALSVVTWNQGNAISDQAMGVQVTRVANWLPTQGVSADNKSTWDLVCFFYDGKNKNCTGAAPKVSYKGNNVKVHLEKNADGSIYLYKYQDKIPLISK